MKLLTAGDSKGSYIETKLSDIPQSYSRSNSERTSNRSETKLLTKKKKETVHVIQDSVTKFCDSRSLTQATAEELRIFGFQSEEELDALDHKTVDQLDITPAQKCLLRKTITIKHSEDFNHSSHKQGSHNGYKGRDNSVNSNSTAGQSFERSHSGDEKDSSYPLLHQYKHGKSQRPREYTGYLSDPGLYKLAESIGESWRKLASKLNISPSEEIDVRRSDSLADGVARMLMRWRDDQQGNDDTIRRNLCQALDFSGRKDLAEMIDIRMNKIREGKVFSKV
ncbi:DgyrCDS1723 [Dimorphilus gyrociliatus]|uniref:DgyrCDS1723 n=1 Tax=Dimorphilus gyrociliatus TaxID=2664684 RepID=A0A7I8V833_9ANNE|nr:DgyrCDS1723 [Dimorphilus gyrociliatus]